MILSMKGITDHLTHNKGEEEALVTTLVEDNVTSAVREQWDFAYQNNLNLRDACYISVFKKQVKHIQECGITM